MNQVQKHRRRKVITAHNKQRADVTGQAYSAGYEAIPHIWFNRPMDLPPFSFATIRGMLIDPEIRLNFATRAAPLCAAEFGWKEGEQWVEGVKCKQPEIAQYIYRQLQHIWRNFLPAILRAQVWGWSAGEVVMKLGENGLIEIDKLEPRHASDVRLLKQGFDRWGVVIDRVEDRGSVQLPFPYAWFHAYNAEDGDDYGVSAAHGAYSPWADKWFNGGAKDVRRLFMHKDAYGGIDLGYPEGETWVEGVENPIPNRDIARSIVEQLKAGGVTTRPSTRDENGNEKWPLTRATVASNPQHILDYPKDLDNEIRHGMEIPDGVSDSAGSGEWAGKRVTVAAFYASLDQWMVQILRDIKEQILDHLCRLNFGSVPNYELCHKPLAEQAMEQQSNAGPQADRNNNGIPDQFEQRPYSPQMQFGQTPKRMSVIEDLANGLSIDNVLSEAKRVIASAMDNNGKQLIEAAGLAVMAEDTGRVLLLQRTLNPDDPASGAWEFPGGHVEPGEEPEQGARREWEEETGQKLPECVASSSWIDGIYQGFVCRIANEKDIDINLGGTDRHVLNPDDPDGDNIEVVAWFSPGQLVDNSLLRDELQRSIAKVIHAIGTARACVIAEPSEAPIPNAEEVDVVENKPGVVMLELPEFVVDAVKRGQETISSEVLAEDGIEEWPHITLLYGILATPIESIIGHVQSIGPIEVQFGQLSLFENEDCNVLKIDVAGDDLHIANAFLADALPVKQTYPDYKPHITLAYVQKSPENALLGPNHLLGTTARLTHAIIVMDGQTIRVPLAPNGVEPVRDTEPSGGDSITDEPPANSE